MTRIAACLLALVCLCWSAARAAVPVNAASPAAAVDATTVNKKFLLGYQGWFAYPGDGSAFNRWFHWFKGQTTTAKELNIDMAPDLSEYGRDEIRYVTVTPSSYMGYYSAYSPKTVMRHFTWMRQYGLDGVMLQRFTLDLVDPKMLVFRDQVLANVRAGAEANGRVFAVMYDITGDNGFLARIKKDWAALVDSKKVTLSPRYLRHKGLPLVCVWGLGFGDRPGTVEEAQDLIQWFKNNPEPRYRATLMGGVPTDWRYTSGDAKDDRRWKKVYTSFDVISPWTVGRYTGVPAADRYKAVIIAKDLQLARDAGREYMPVIFPGSSDHNLTKGGRGLNSIRRLGGEFYWRQAYNAVSAGCTLLYGAMFDEVDEGTAIYKVIASKDRLPAGVDLLGLDSEGYKLPGDWYLRVAGMITKMVHGEIPASSRMPLDPGNPAASNAFFPQATPVK